MYDQPQILNANQITKTKYRPIVNISVHKPRTKVSNFNLFVAVYNCGHFLPTNPIAKLWTCEIFNVDVFLHFIVSLLGLHILYSLNARLNCQTILLSFMSYDQLNEEDTPSLYINNKCNTQCIIATWVNWGQGTSLIYSIYLSHHLIIVMTVIIMTNGAILSHTTGCNFHPQTSVYLKIAKSWLLI